MLKFDKIYGLLHVHYGNICLLMGRIRPDEIDQISMGWRTIS